MTLRKNRLLFVKNFYNKTLIGPTISIQNDLNKDRQNNIFIIDHNFQNKKQKKLKNCKIFFINNFISVIKNLKSINNIIKKSDIVEFHSLFDGFVVLPILLILLNKKKLIKIYLRGMVNDHVLKKKKNFKIIYLLIIKRFLKNAVIVCTSKYELRVSFKFFKKNKFIIENNQVSSKYLNIKNTQIVKKKKNLKILFFSNITWKKNFIYCYKILMNINFPVELNIYGKCLIDKGKFLNMINLLKTKHTVNYHGYYNSFSKKKSLITIIFYFYLL